MQYWRPYPILPLPDASPMANINLPRPQKSTLDWVKIQKKKEQDLFSSDLKFKQMILKYLETSWFL